TSNMHLLVYIFLLLLSSSPLGRDLHSFPTRRSSDLGSSGARRSRSWLHHRDTIARWVRCRGRSAASAVSRGRWTSFSSSPVGARSEEHTSELQSRGHLVCRLLLEKKKTKLANLQSQG